MSKSTVTYSVMLVLSAAGLWLVLEFGSNLRAAPDLKGRWELFPATDASDETEAFCAWMDVEQSGRYLQIAFENGLKLDAKLAEVLELPSKGAVTRLRLRLSAGEWALRVEGAARADELDFDLVGPRSHRFVGRRPSHSHTEEGRPERH